MTDHATSAPDDERMPMRTRVISVGVVVVCLGIAAVVLLKVSAPRISPAQSAPRAHYAAPCSWCHVRDADVSLIEVR